MAKALYYRARMDGWKSARVWLVLVVFGTVRASPTREELLSTVHAHAPHTFTWQWRHSFSWRCYLAEFVSAAEEILHVAFFLFSPSSSPLLLFQIIMFVFFSFVTFKSRQNQTDATQQVGIMIRLQYGEGTESCAIKWNRAYYKTLIE